MFRFSWQIWDIVHSYSVALADVWLLWSHAECTLCISYECFCHRHRIQSLEKELTCIFCFKIKWFSVNPTQRHMTQEPVLLLCCASLMTQSLWVTHQPTLNSTWASNRATTGAVAALHPLTLDRIRPSCLACRTIFMNPGRWLLVSDTKSSSFSFRSSTKRTEILHQYLKSFWRSRLR